METPTPINYMNCPIRAKIIKYYENENVKVIHIEKLITGGKSSPNYHVVLASKIELDRDFLKKPNAWHGQFNGIFNDTYFYEVRFNRYVVTSKKAQ